jgi:NAD(P) transhydrogenase subunit alpha
VNIASTIPMHASQMYSKNVVTLLGEFVDEEGQVKLDFVNDVVGPATLTHAGEIKHEKVREAAGSAR